MSCFYVKKLHSGFNVEKFPVFKYLRLLWTITYLQQRLEFINFIQIGNQSNDSNKKDLFKLQGQGLQYLQFERFLFFFSICKTHTIIFAFEFI